MRRLEWSEHLRHLLNPMFCGSSVVLLRSYLSTRYGPKVLCTITTVCILVYTLLHVLSKIQFSAITLRCSASALVPDCSAHRDASTSEGRRADHEHTDSVRNIHSGKHCAAKHADLRVVMRARQVAGGSAGDVSNSCCSEDRRKWCTASAGSSVWL
jgi:hypothetical protein